MANRCRGRQTGVADRCRAPPSPPPRSQQGSSGHAHRAPQPACAPRGSWSLWYWRESAMMLIPHPQDFKPVAVPKGKWGPSSVSVSAR